VLRADEEFESKNGFVLVTLLRDEDDDGDKMLERGIGGKSNLLYLLTSCCAIR